MAIVKYVEHGRKDFKKMPRNRDIEANIITAVEHTALFHGSDRYLEYVKLPLTLCGKTAASIMEESDNPILFLPIWVSVESGEEGGCLITFEDKVLIGWTEGKLRLTYFAHSVPCSTISAVKELPEFEVHFEADRPWTVTVQAPAFKHDEFMPLLMNTLNGNGLDSDSTSPDRV
jgi:hypothetical protein